MVEGIWREREQALENAFFMKRNEELLAKLREKLSREERKKALSEACGISDDRVLDQLIKVDIDAEAVTALVMVPLVMVAWADGKMDDKERTAILQAADAEGIAEGTLCHQLLDGWLAQQPGDQLYAAWRDFVGVVVTEFSPDALAAFRQDVLNRVRKVAQAAGGLLGLSTISAAEQQVLDQLEADLSS